MVPKITKDVPSLCGYAGKILEIDLSTGSCRQITLTPPLARDYIGGSGLAARLYLDLLGGGPYPEPFDPANPLFLMTGPVAGHLLPGSSRFCLCSRSPLTGLWGEASCGGYLAPALKAAGYDGLIVTGAAASPVYILVEDGHGVIREATDLWGRDTYETVDVLKARHGPTARVLAIGPGGENLVRFAAAVHDKGHVAGRTGMGAVMGSKKLKAVVALGSGKVAPADPEAIKALRQAVLAKQEGSLASQTFRSFGTAGTLYVGSMMGDVPLQNWRAGTWDDANFQALDGTAMAETILTKTRSCHSCTIACKRQVAVPDGPFPVPEGPGPEYETIAALGSLNLIADLKAIARANDMCNRYGLDTISCGGTIAFAIEATERGFLQSRLAWGEPVPVLEAIEAIAYRRGLGNLLAEGSQRAAAALGLANSDLVLTVKGLEVPMHSPRAYHGLGLGYATAPRGACHNAANCYLEMGAVYYPELGVGGPFVERSSEGKALVSARGQDYACVLNAASFCLFNSLNYTVTQTAQALAAITGFPYTVEEIARAGERLWHLKHGINLLLGATAAADRLPERLLMPLADGPTAGSVPDMTLMLREFYALRGLDEHGRPAAAVLEGLGLADLARLLK